MRPDEALHYVENVEAHASLRDELAHLHATLSQQRAELERLRAIEARARQVASEHGHRIGARQAVAAEILGDAR